MTKTDIANIALDSVGRDPIGDILSPGSDKVAQRLSRLYETAAYYVLTQHPFKEAIAYFTVVDEATDSYISHLTANVSGDNTLVVTTVIAAHTPRTGTLIVTYDTGETDALEYASWATSTFTLASGVTLPRTYDDGDTVTLIANNSSKWGRMYDLPTDSLKVLDLNTTEDVAFIVEGAFIYTDAYSESHGIVIRYIKDIRAESSSVVLFSDQVGEAIGARMAFMISKPTQKETFRAIFEDILQEAIWTDGDESVSGGQYQGERWSDVR